MDDLAIHIAAYGLGVRPKRPTLPWEKFPLNHVLGTDKKDLVPKPVLVQAPGAQRPGGSGSKSGDPGPDAEDQPAAKRAKASRGVAPWVKKTALSASWLDALDEERSEALEAWRIITLVSKDQTSIGRTLLGMQAENASSKEIDQVIRDVFANKASGTLRSRASSVLQFAWWRSSAQGLPNVPVFPVSEPEAYSYLCGLKHPFQGLRGSWRLLHFARVRWEPMCKVSFILLGWQAPPGGKLPWGLVRRCL